MASLQSVCADDVSRGNMFNDEMIANGIKRILVQAGGVGLFKSFVEFEVEDLKTQGLRGPDFLPVPRQACRVVPGRTDQQPD